MKKQLLFVMNKEGELDEGLTYAIDLARSMNEGLSILMVGTKKLMQRFEDIMSAVTFAEAGEQVIAREFLSDSPATLEAEGRRILNRCHQAGIEASLHISDDGPLNAVADFIKNMKSVDVVLLGPAMIGDGHISERDLKKLLRTAARPIVTMSRNMLQTA